MVSVIIANRLFPECIRAAVCSHPFHCRFDGEIKMHIIFHYSDLFGNHRGIFLD